MNENRDPNKFHLPIGDPIRDARVGCAGCGRPAPFTLRQYELGPVPAGWQLRLIATDVIDRGQPARAWRWDLFCPADAGERSPRPPGSVRIRIEDDAPEASGGAESGRAKGATG